MSDRVPLEIHNYVEIAENVRQARPVLARGRIWKVVELWAEPDGKVSFSGVMARVINQHNDREEIDRADIAVNHGLTHPAAKASA